MVENKKFKLNVSANGNVSSLTLSQDQHEMNWVVSEEYLSKANFEDEDKLFGNFKLMVDGEMLNSQNIQPIISKEINKTTIIYSFNHLEIAFSYDLSQSEENMMWNIKLINKSHKEIMISDLSVWASFSYMMYRINDLNLQTNHSAAVFPSISQNFTKLACVRRSHTAPHLGMYQTKGETLSVGTYCRFKNLFFENASPSLDGLLFHELVLAGGYPENFENSDWIYSKKVLTLSSGEGLEWEYAVYPFDTQEDFYEIGKQLGHPVFNFEPLAILNQKYDFSFELPKGVSLEEASVEYLSDENKIVKQSILPLIIQCGNEYTATLIFNEVSEHKILILLNNGKNDSVVINVMEPIESLISQRVQYVSNVLYQGAEGDVPYSYSPISNQGESLGKLSLVLKKNLIENLNPEEVQKVEASCVNYIRPKWFKDSDFTKPNYLYGDFYRCMDFEYIGHVFYLLSQFNEETLTLNHPDTYLNWAADVFCLRVNPDLHHDKRGKEEAQMLGVFCLYIDDLLQGLKNRGLTDKYEQIRTLWSKIAQTVADNSETYQAAVTEHFYDNAGFGPAAGALAGTNHIEAAKRYGELLLANTGFSNDFRSQNPDRWWEALSYMIHSLWGGVTAAATLKAYERLRDIRYLKAAYRATVGMLYCYDNHARATNTKLKRGEAASTYSVAGPNLNRPDLSRNRFGQSTFARDGGIFTRLFPKEEETADWDMGEELVVYLEGFGKKTFLYMEGEQLKVVNGSLEKAAEGWIIHSYAPYCTEYHYYDGDEHFISETGEVVKTIRFVDGKFMRS